MYVMRACTLYVHIHMYLLYSNPDVMLEVFYEKHVSVIFFLAYLVITFYYLMNVVSIPQAAILVCTALH